MISILSIKRVQILTLNRHYNNKRVQAFDSVKVKRNLFKIKDNLKVSFKLKGGARALAAGN